MGDTTRHWLFKTEPDVYSISHLAAEATRSTTWDGIRNYQARNILRDQVAIGDLVLIYHSSCKTPGAAGIARVVSGAYADPSQFKPKSPYFDPKSTADRPRWYCLDIRLERQFEALIPGTVLKATPGLESMVLFRQGRLSVQPVAAEEWRIIEGLARAP